MKAEDNSTTTETENAIGADKFYEFVESDCHRAPTIANPTHYVALLELLGAE